jgi:hypothetical protein
MDRLARVVGPLLAIVVLTLAGCTDPDHPVFNEYEGGYRLDADGDLIMWMGGDCHGVTALRLELVNGAGNVYETWGVRSTSAEGGEVSTVAVDAVPRGFREVDPLERDWRDADTAHVVVRTTSSQVVAYFSVSSFLADADQRADAWYVQDRGWYTQDDYRADLMGRDNADIYPLCTVHG